MKDSFWLCNKNFEVLDSCWSEQQTLEVSSSGADHENAGPLHLATSSSSESYDLDLILHSAKAWWTSSISEQTFWFQWIDRKNYNQVYLWTTYSFTMKQFFTSNFGKVKPKLPAPKYFNAFNFEPLKEYNWHFINCLFLSNILYKILAPYNALL